MTNEQAIAHFKEQLEVFGGEHHEAMKVAIEALEKQMPKKPIYSDFDDNGFDEIIPHRAECPACGESVEFGKWNDEESHHCECGQAIDWSEQNDRYRNHKGVGMVLR